MTKYIILSLFFLLSSLGLLAQPEIKKGIVVGGGIGNISSEVKPNKNIASYDVSHKLNAFVGYRIRVLPKLEPFYIDTDINIGILSWKSKYNEFGNAVGNPPTKESSNQYYHLSVNGTFNYKIYQGLSLGVGVSPTYYFYEDGDKGKNKFDAPLSANIAYDFGKLAVGVTYKYGLVNIMETDYLKKGKTRDFQLSVFVPF